MFFETTLTRERIERLTASGDWPNRLLGDYLDDAIARHAEKTAVVDVRSRYTYRELRQWSDAAALAFLASGVRPRDVVTVQLPNWNEFVIVTLALERIGAVINPVAPIFRHREMRSILRLAGSVAVVMPASFRGFDYPAMYAELARELPAIGTQVVVGGSPLGDGVAWEEFLERVEKPPDLDLLRPHPNEVIELMFTSGTTGEPKGVMHTANTISAAVEPVIRALELTGDDVCHMASTLGHQTGFLYGVHLPIRLGARVIYQEVWDAVHFVKLVEAERITFTMGATPFLADTVAAPNRAHHDLSSLRIFVCGGAPIPRPLAERVSETLPCRLVPGWGMTEVGLVTTVTPADPAEKIVASDGHPFRGMEVLVRGESGERAAPGSEGDLYVRGPAEFVGYSQGREVTRRYFDADGWFATGDRASMDADGYIRITGRTKDLIIRGGENVPVKEIEDVLLRHPEVASVALVALAHPRLGEIGCACVIAKNGTTPSLRSLSAFLEAEQVTRQFWPEELVLLEEFPMTPSGKVQKFRLREIAASRVK